MDTEQIPVVENNEQISAPEPISIPENQFSEVKKVKSFKGRPVIAILVFVVIVLVCGLTYFVLKDNGIDLLSGDVKETTNEESKTEDTACPTDTKTADIATEKTGNFQVDFSYPSEGTPAVRLCFTNVDEISEQYCFWQKASKDTAGYANDLESGKGTLPIGTYAVDYTVYGGYYIGKAYEQNYAAEVFTLRQCSYHSNGGGDYTELVKKDCTLLPAEFDKYKVMVGGYRLPMELINQLDFGGNRITFTITENQTTEMGTLELSPYPS